VGGSKNRKRGGKERGRLDRKVEDNFLEVVCKIMIEVNGSSKSTKAGQKNVPVALVAGGASLDPSKGI